ESDSLTSVNSVIVLSRSIRMRNVVTLQNCNTGNLKDLSCGDCSLTTKAAIDKVSVVEENVIFCRTEYSETLFLVIIVLIECLSCRKEAFSKCNGLSCSVSGTCRATIILKVVT